MRVTRVFQWVKSYLDALWTAVEKFGDTALEQHYSKVFIRLMIS